MFRGKNGAFALLCNCIRDSACPVANQPKVTDEEWMLVCTCCGGDSLGESVSESEMKLIFASPSKKRRFLASISATVVAQEPFV